MPSEEAAAKKGTQRASSGATRKKRSDAGTTLLNERDRWALTWIGHQYGLRLDHLQWLLGRAAGRGAAYDNWISEGAARDVVTRWKRGKWVQTERIRAQEPLWIWPTRLGLQKVGLPYTYRNIGQTSLDDLSHLFAINEIRIHMGDEDRGAQWVSERQLLQGMRRAEGRELLHRPDGEIHWPNGEIFAIEAELSAKKPWELAENLMELLRGEGYLRMKAACGWRGARALSRGYQSRYAAIWYFAPEKIRRLVWRECRRLVEQGDLSEQEAARLVVRRYPLIETDEEIAQEEQENSTALHLKNDEGGQGNSEDDEVRPWREQGEREE
jgi:hypothetical protein